METCRGDVDVPVALDRPRGGVRPVGLHLPGQPLRAPVRATAARGRVPVPGRRRAAGRGRALRRRAGRVPVDARAVRHHRALGPPAARVGQRHGRGRPAGGVVRAGRTADRRRPAVDRAPARADRRPAADGDDRGRGRRGGGPGGAGVRGPGLRRCAGHHVVGTVAGAAGRPGLGHRDLRDHPPAGAAQPVRAGRRADADGRGGSPGGGHRAGGAPRRHGRVALLHLVAGRTSSPPTCSSRPWSTTGRRTTRTCS